MTKVDALQIVREEMKKCMKCGNCQAVCPIYQETKSEANVARGKIKLAEAVLKGELELTPGFNDKMFKCLLCKTCMENCPCGVQLDRVVLAAREAVAEEKGLHPVKKAIFQVLKRPAVFDLGLKVGGHFQGLAFKRRPDGIGCTPRFPVGLDMKRVIPKIRTRSVKDSFPPVIPARPTGDIKGGNVKPKMRVAFFTGCTINHMFTDVGKAVVEVLTRNGVEVVIPQMQHCCGVPVFAHGDLKTAREMALSNISIFEKAEVDGVIVACGTCTSAWKHNFPDWLKDTPHYEKALSWGEKTFEITDFLLHRIDLNENLGRVPMKVTYHDSCHLNRELGITQAPRELIKKIPGVELVEMKNPGRCCGGAGSFSLLYYDLSLGILEKKMADARATGADSILTGCSGCKMQLEDGAARFFPGVKIMHPVQLLEMAYRRYDQEQETGAKAG